MSLNNNINIKNNCDHIEQLNKTKILNDSYFFCFKCSHIILLYDNKPYCVYKINSEEEEEINNDIKEFDPVTTIRNMLKRIEEQIKYINEKLVLNLSNNDIDGNIKENKDSKNNEYINEKINESYEKINKEENIIKKVNSEIISLDDISSKKKISKLSKLLIDEEIFDKYVIQRNKVLVYIHKLCTKLKYNDNTFYMTLYLADTYLSKIITDDISDKDLFLVILGFFLISSKYIEDDIFEPDFEAFCNFQKNIEPLTIEEIRTSEVQCLMLLNHNLYIYSVYDWLNILFNNGIIFEEEINDINGLEKVYIYSQKLLTTITSKIYFCRYSSVQIAFSIIQLSREKYDNKNLKLSKKLFDLLLFLYGIEFSDYEECYKIIKLDLIENNELDTSEEEKEEFNNSIINTNNNTNLNTNINSLEINKKINNSNTLNNDRNNRNIYELEKISRENKFRISIDARKDLKYLKTDINIKGRKLNPYNLISSFDNKKKYIYHHDKYKLRKNINYILDNNSIDILEHNKEKKNLTPNIITNADREYLNNTNIKSNNNFNTQNKAKNLINDYYKKEINSIKNEKSQKINALYINYAPKFLIKNIGPTINNINYVNNISIGNECINFDKDKKLEKKKNSLNVNSNGNFTFKINKNKNEIRSNTNHVLRKALFNLKNIAPIQLNYEYNINNINNNKIKNENTNINKLQNKLIQNNKIKNNEKLKVNNKEKFKSHLLLDFYNAQNLNNIFLNSNKISKQGNKETRSLNKYNFNDYDINKKMKNLNKNKNEIKIMNTNININMNINNNFKSNKITLNFKDIVNQKINNNQNHVNNFLTNNNNIKSKRIKSINNNFYNKDSVKSIEKKYTIFNNDNKYNEKEMENEKRKKDKSKNYFIDANQVDTDSKNSIVNYRNIGSFRTKLPKLKLNKNSLLTS